jgi:hypothetical protein
MRKALLPEKQKGKKVSNRLLGKIVKDKQHQNT